VNFMKTVQKIKEVKTEEVISGNDTKTVQRITLNIFKPYHVNDYDE
jgi:hypothetical protein